MRQSLFAGLFSEVSYLLPQLRDLLTPRHHSQQSSRQRYKLVISRVQFISFVFAIAVPLWIIVDAMILDDIWPQLAVYRTVSAIVFLMLALPRNLPPNFTTATSMLVLMLLIPPVMYLLTMPLMLSVPDVGLQGVLRDLYSFLPYIVMGGLAIFPLTALEILVLSLPIISVMTFGNTWFEASRWEEQVSTLWLLIVIMGISGFSAMSQLQYLIALVQRATLDPLTSTFTRRTGTETLELQYRFATMHDRPFALAFVDIDNFKSINDRFGHERGDLVLIDIARRLEAGLRRGDSLIRWGGEEFLVVLANTDEGGTRQVIDRIMANGFGRRPDDIPVTASVGVAERVKDCTGDWTELVNLADNRMYKAKERGKNRAVFDDTLEICGPRILSVA